MVVVVTPVGAEDCVDVEVVVVVADREVAGAVVDVDVVVDVVLVVDDVDVLAAAIVTVIEAGEPDEMLA